MKVCTYLSMNIYLMLGKQGNNKSANNRTGDAEFEAKEQDVS